MFILLLYAFLLGATASSRCARIAELGLLATSAAVVFYVLLKELL